jgi:uncharacterized tellurite resistance protein B-like protein
MDDVNALDSYEAKELYEQASDLLEHPAIQKRPGLYQALMALAADLEDRLNVTDPLCDGIVEVEVAQ